MARFNRIGVFLMVCVVLVTFFTLNLLSSSVENRIERKRERTHYHQQQDQQQRQQRASRGEQRVEQEEEASYANIVEPSKTVETQHQQTHDEPKPKQSVAHHHAHSHNGAQGCPYLKEGDLNGEIGDLAAFREEIRYHAEQNGVEAERFGKWQHNLEQAKRETSTSGSAQNKSYQRLVQAMYEAEQLMGSEIHLYKLKVVVVLATWCPMALASVPPLLEAVESANAHFASTQPNVIGLRIFAVDRAKQESTGFAQEHDIKRVPTIIVVNEKDGKAEMTRFVEVPAQGDSFVDDITALIHDIVAKHKQKN